LLELLRDLGLDVEREKRAWSVSYALRSAPLPRAGCVEVVGPFGGPRTECPKLAVDGAANLLSQYDFLLSDLDGAREDEVIRASEEKVLFLVLHGNNFERALRMPLGKNVVYVVQSPRAKGLCLPAFSDGDKALLLAELISERVYVSGFREGEQPRETKGALVHPLKELKLSLSRAYGVEGALGRYGSRPLDEGKRRGLRGVCEES